jgi:serine/threonine protein kinase
MEALDFDEPRERSAYIHRVCDGDERLRARVEALLRRHQADDRLALDRMPAVDSSLTEDLTQPVEEPGTSIGPYKLLEQIGEGGMGVVYVAEQTQPMRRRVALKIIKPGMDTKQVIARFEAERQALALMDHPNIARVHDGGATESGRPYFVMELVRGIPITDYCDREQLSIPDRLELFVLVCRAVQHAHQKGLIHRDLKPSNILVTLIDGAAVPKIIDFGVAKATGSSLTERTLYTGFHQFVGTPMYMSPEQADLSGMDVDTRSDIYSLGVLLYELLAGTTPFDPQTFRAAAYDEMRRIIREEEPPKPSTRISNLGVALPTVSARRKADPKQLAREVQGELDWIVMKALEKDRRRRYETANDFAADLMRCLSDQPVAACPPSAAYRFGKFARRNRVALTTAALVSGALLLGLTASLVMAVRATEAERRTTTAFRQARDHLAEADRQRAYARKAVDEMYTQVAEKWLSRAGGLTPLQRDFLEKALAFYEEFARRNADDPEARAEVAQAAVRVGEIRTQLGLSAGALESHHRALEAFRRLATDFPDRPEYRRGVARNLHDIGRLNDSLSRTSDAEPALREAIALRERLAEVPRAPEDRADLAVSLQSLGTLLESTGRPADAEQAQLRGIDLLTQLVREFPKEPRFQNLLAAAELSLGRLYLYRARTDDAQPRYRHALKLRQRLANDHPAEPEYQLGLAQCHFALGDFFRLIYFYLGAAEEFRRALPIEEKLAADHPDRPGYRALLARTRWVLAQMLVRMGKLDEAEQASQRSLEVAEKLAAEFPDSPDYRELLVNASVELGYVHAQHGRNREARNAFERAYDVQRKLSADYPDRSHYRHDLAQLCYDEAVNYATFIRMEKRDAARALELASKAVEIGAKAPPFWKGLALAHYKTGDFDAALRAETKALELRKGGSYGYDWLLLALIHLGRGDREQARPWALGVIHSPDMAAWGAGEADLERLVRESESRLKALLPTDPEGLRAALEHELDVERRRHGPGGSFTIKLTNWLANQLAALGRYDKAIALFKESERLKPDADTFGPRFPLGVLMLKMGDVNGYRALCSQMLRECEPEGTTAKNPWTTAMSPWLADQIARLCTAAPGAVDDPKRLLALGRRAASADGQNPSFLLARAAAEFRAGEFQAAVEVLPRSVARWEYWEYPYPPCRAQANLFLAMAHHRLGHAEEARRALAEADRALAEVPVKPDPVTLLRAWDWRERTLAQILRREAGMLLGVPLPRDSKN